MFSFYRFKVDMSQFPVISRIHESLSGLEAFKVAHPSQQPDCPEDLRNWYDPLTEFFNGNCSFSYKIVTKRQKREIKVYHRTFLVFFIVLHHFSGLKSLRKASRTPSPFACGTRVTSRDSPKWRACLQAKKYLERFHISDKSVEIYISAWITQRQGHGGAHAHLRCLRYDKCL